MIPSFASALKLRITLPFKESSCKSVDRGAFYSVIRKKTHPSQIDITISEVRGVYLGIIYTPDY